MIKVMKGCTRPTLLDIKTKDGKQVFHGEVKISDGAFFDTDNAHLRIKDDMVNHRYICEVEV